MRQPKLTHKKRKLRLSPNKLKSEQKDTCHTLTSEEFALLSNLQKLGYTKRGGNIPVKNYKKIQDTLLLFNLLT